MDALLEDGFLHSLVEGFALRVLGWFRNAAHVHDPFPIDPGRGTLGSPDPESFDESDGGDISTDIFATTLEAHNVDMIRHNKWISGSILNRCAIFMIETVLLCWMPEFYDGDVGDMGTMGYGIYHR